MLREGGDYGLIDSDDDLPMPYMPRLSELDMGTGVRIHWTPTDGTIFAFLDPDLTDEARRAHRERHRLTQELKRERAAFDNAVQALWSTGVPLERLSKAIGVGVGVIRSAISPSHHRP